MSITIHVIVLVYAANLCGVPFAWRLKLDTKKNIIQTKNVSRFGHLEFRERFMFKLLIEQASRFIWRVKGKLLV